MADIFYHFNYVVAGLTAVVIEWAYHVAAQIKELKVAYLKFDGKENYEATSSFFLRKFI